MNGFKKLLQFEFSEEICTLIDIAAKANGGKKREIFLRTEMKKFSRQLVHNEICTQKKKKKHINIYVYDEELWNFYEQLACRMSTNLATITAALVIFPNILPHLLEEKGIITTRIKVEIENILIEDKYYSFDFRLYMDERIKKQGKYSDTHNWDNNKATFQKMLEDGYAAELVLQGFN